MLWTFRDSCPYLKLTDIEWDHKCKKKKGLFLRRYAKQKHKGFRSELHTLTQASYTVSTFLHIKQGFVASHQKPEKELQA